MRKLILAAFIVVVSGPASAQQATKPFEPVSGQAGKDVVWVPTSPALVDLMMKVAKVTRDDFVMDLGSGDGRNIIAAAKLGANGLGVEFNPDMVALSRRLATEAGVADKARFVEADMYEADISKANVLALFLLPVNMNRLAPKFLELAPGSRIVANTFGIEGWEPDLRANVRPARIASWCEALLWIVPAKVRRLGMAGRLARAGTELPVVRAHQGRMCTRAHEGKMQGDVISFIAGGMTYTGKVSGEVIEGTVTTPSGSRPWRAARSKR